MPSNQLIAIVGFMGCGKTAVARLVAAKLHREMADLDDLISERYGRTAAQIISEDGESQFRSIETGVLRDLLANGFNGVLSLGGGAWTVAANRDLLKENGALTVWLDTAFEECWRRIESAEKIRPLAPTKAQAKSLFEKRLPTYELASVRVKSLSDETLELLSARLAMLLSEC